VGPNNNFHSEPTIGQMFVFFQSTLSTILQQREVERAEWQRQLGELKHQYQELEKLLKLQQSAPRGQGQWQRGSAQRRPRPVIPTAPAEDTPEVNNYLERSAQLDAALRNGTSVAVEGAKCQIFEHVGDIRDAPEVIKVQAVAADLKCSVGVAAAFTERLGPPKDEPGRETAIGDVVVQEAGDMGTLLNVVIKDKSHHKYYKKPEPYLAGVKMAFRKIAEYIKKEQFEEVAVTYMCSGTERLHRLFTMDLLYNELKDVPVKVHYYNKFPSRRWQGAGNLFRADGDEEQPEPNAASQGEQQATQGTRKSARPKTATKPRFGD
jgi:hypothetical protein